MRHWADLPIVRCKFVIEVPLTVGDCSPPICSEIKVMPIESLNDYPDDQRIEASVVIVGAGPCGLTLARSLSDAGHDVLVLESGGLSEDDAHEALNTVDIAEGCWSDTEAAARDIFHRSLTTHWDGARQTYGVRCRGLGGATQAWAGKSAPFDEIDYAKRAWVPLSGWPIKARDLDSFLDRASEILNLGPGPYDAALWDRIGRTPPTQPIGADVFQTYFWKFARSRHHLTDIMRFGKDFAADPPHRVRLLTHATVTRLLSNEDGRAIRGLESQSLSGRKLTVTAPTIVLAASTIENARLLLLSRDVEPKGLGNRHDCVGRYLMDHPTATIAHFGVEAASEMAARFGLYGHRDGGRTHVYMNGLALDPAWQRAENALNGALSVAEERAPDDPFSAAKRLLKRRSKSVVKDALAVARSPVRLSRGVAARAIERGYVPAPISKVIVDLSLRVFPNTVARDFQSGRLPAKISSLRVQASTEQPPLAENRIELSDLRDSLNIERARVTWTAGEAARTNLLRIADAFQNAMTDAPQLHQPAAPDWVTVGRPDQAVVIDLGHPMGSTRMSDTPKTGVVDSDCKLHGVEGLYVAGGSVMPTSGHTNPTLMMLALTLRLSDRLAAQLRNR